MSRVISPGSDEEQDGGADRERHRYAHEHGTERLLAKEVDEDLTDLLFQEPPPPEAYPDQ